MNEIVAFIYRFLAHERCCANPPRISCTAKFNIATIPKKERMKCIYLNYTAQCQFSSYEWFRTKRGVDRKENAAQLSS